MTASNGKNHDLRARIIWLVDTGRAMGTNFVDVDSELMRGTIEFWAGRDVCVKHRRGTMQSACAEVGIEAGVYVDS